MFSAYDIYDINCDVYDTSNYNLKELELEYDSTEHNDETKPSTYDVLES